MSKMMDDPKMMKMMTDTLNSMPPEQLADMMSAQVSKDGCWERLYHFMMVVCRREPS
jgi:hypothetical protein